jgi:hypothetical protein
MKFVCSSECEMFSGGELCDFIKNEIHTYDDCSELLVICQVQIAMIESEIRPGTEDQMKWC